MRLVDLHVMVGCEQASKSADRDGEAHACGHMQLSGLKRNMPHASAVCKTQASKAVCKPLDWQYRALPDRCQAALVMLTRGRDLR